MWRYNVSVETSVSFRGIGTDAIRAFISILTLNWMDGWMDVHFASLWLKPCDFITNVTNWHCDCRRYIINAENKPKKSPCLKICSFSIEINNYMYSLKVIVIKWCHDFTPTRLFLSLPTWPLVAHIRVMEVITSCRLWWQPPRGLGRRERGYCLHDWAVSPLPSSLILCPPIYH